MTERGTSGLIAAAVCRGRLRTAACLAALSVVASMMASVGHAAPASIGHARQVVEDHVVGLAEAHAIAEATGERAEVESQRGEQETVYAEPDGSVTVDVASEPVWAIEDEVWVHTDTSLVATGDGRVEPKAVSFPIEFSAGGAGVPLVRMQRDEVAISLTWPDSLPEPAVSGPTATYADVFPGVDLQLTAEPEGFSHLLVVHDRTAASLPALDAIPLGLDVTGGQVTPTDGVEGGLEVVNTFGDVMLEVGQPLMWDAGGDADFELSEGDHPASIPLTLDGDSVTMTPDQGLLEGVDTTYPVVLDPGWSPDHRRWAMVFKEHPTMSFYRWKGPRGQGVGFQNERGVSTKRLFFQYPLGRVAGADILGATFRAKLVHSWSCTKTPVELWRTGPIDRRTTWNRQPDWISLQDTKSFNARRVGCEDVGEFDARVVLDAKAAVQTRADAHADSITLGLRAPDEANANQWKRLLNDATLSITFNYPPSEPFELKTVDPFTKCASTPASADIIPKDSPMLSGRIYDSKSAQVSQLEATFQLDRWNATQGQFVEQFTRGGINGSSGDTFRTEVGQALLADGGLFRWRMRGKDPKVAGPWSRFCHFKVDVDAPPAPEITGLDPDHLYPLGQGISGIRIQAASNDNVAYFRWSVNYLDPAPNSRLDAGPGNGAGLTIPARELWAAGPHTLRVWSYDAAGNVTHRAARRTFTVYETPATSAYPLDEGTGTTSADVLAPSGSRYLSWSTSAQIQWHGPAREGSTDLWLGFRGIDGPTTATASTASDIDSGDNFTVAAWIRPGQKQNAAIAVSQDGPNNAAFALGLGGDCANRDGSASPTCYQFTVRSESGTEVVKLRSRTPVVRGKWMLLVGVYNAGTHTATFYVEEYNPDLLPADLDPVQSDVDFDVLLADTGRTRVGSSLVGGSQAAKWTGAIDDVTEWPDVVGRSRVIELIEQFPKS